MNGQFFPLCFLVQIQYVVNRKPITIYEWSFFWYTSVYHARNTYIPIDDIPLIMEQERVHSLVAEALKEIVDVMDEYPSMPIPRGNTEYFLAVVAQILLRIEKRLKTLEQFAAKDSLSSPTLVMSKRTFV